MISPVRFGATPQLTQEQFTELQGRVQNVHTDIKAEILRHLSADLWEGTINRMLATNTPSREDLNQLHLVTAYKGQNILKKTDQNRPVLVEAIRQNRPILYNWFLKIAGDQGRREKLLNQTTPWGDTALQTAILHDRFQTAKELMEQGAKPSLDDANLAASHGKRAFLERRLLPALKLEKAEENTEEITNQKSQAQQKRDELVALAISQQARIQHHQSLHLQHKNEMLLAWSQTGNHQPEHLAGLIRAGAKVNVVDDHMKTPLFYAIETGRGWLIDVLLLHGADLNIKARNGHTVLNEAIRRKDISLIKKLLSHQPDLTLKQGNYPENTYLHTALETNKREIIEVILRHQPDLVLVENQQGQIPIKEAIRNGKEEAVELMVAHYPELLRYRDRYGSGPQHWAASAGNVNIVAMLFPKNIPISEIPDGLGNSLLHLAAERGHTEMVKFLIPHEMANITRPNHYQRTPLFEAASSGKLGTVLALLAHHPTNTQHFSCDGYLPLHIALRNPDHGDIVNALVKHDPASRQARNKREQNLLHILPAYPHHAKLLQELTQQCPEMLTEQDVDGLTPVHHAVENKNLQAVQTFLEANPNLVNQANGQGEFPIHRAMPRYKEGIITELLKQDRKTVNTPNPAGEPPLYYAVKHYHRPLPMLKELLNAGADINQADGPQAQSPLHIAVIYRDPEVVSELLKYGPDPDKTDQSGKTALTLAKEARQKAEKKISDIRRESDKHSADVQAIMLRNAERDLQHRIQIENALKNYRKSDQSKLETTHRTRTGLCNSFQNT